MMKKKHSHSLRFVNIVENPGHIHDYDTNTAVSDHHRH